MGLEPTISPLGGVRVIHYATGAALWLGFDPACQAGGRLVRLAGIESRGLAGAWVNLGFDPRLGGKNTPAQDRTGDLLRVKQTS